MTARKRTRKTVPRVAGHRPVPGAPARPNPGAAEPAMAAAPTGESRRVVEHRPHTDRHLPRHPVTTAPPPADVAVSEPSADPVDAPDAPPTDVDAFVDVPAADEPTVDDTPAEVSTDVDSAETEASAPEEVPSAEVEAPAESVADAPAPPPVVRTPPVQDLPYVGLDVSASQRSTDSALSSLASALEDAEEAAVAAVAALRRQWSLPSDPVAASPAINDPSQTDVSAAEDQVELQGVLEAALAETALAVDEPDEQAAADDPEPVVSAEPVDDVVAETHAVTDASDTDVSVAEAATPEASDQPEPVDAASAEPDDEPQPVLAPAPDADREPAVAAAKSEAVAPEEPEAPEEDDDEPPAAVVDHAPAPDPAPVAVTTAPAPAPMVTRSPAPPVALPAVRAVERRPMPYRRPGPGPATTALAPTARRPVEVPPTLTEPAPRPRASSTTTAKARRRRLLIIELITAAVLVAVAVTFLIVRSHGSGGRTGSSKQVAQSTGLTSSPSAVAGSAVTWMQKNLPAQRGLVAPAAWVDALRQAGFAHTLADSGRDLNWSGVAYIVTVGDGQSSSAAQLEAGRHGAPLAVFGRGRNAATVVQLLTDISATPADVVARDRATRQQAGSELLNNPAVRPDAGARAVLADGRLDLRAAAILVSLAEQGDVTVSQMTQDPAEAAAGLPVRQMTVRMDQRSTVDDVLADAQSDYQPQSADNVGADAKSLIWSPAIAAVTTVG